MVGEASVSLEANNYQDFIDALIRNFVEDTGKEHVPHGQLVGFEYACDFLGTCRRNRLLSNHDIHEELFQSIPSHDVGKAVPRLNSCYATTCLGDVSRTWSR